MDPRYLTCFDVMIFSDKLFDDSGFKFLELLLLYFADFYFLSVFYNRIFTSTCVKKMSVIVWFHQRSTSGFYSSRIACFSCNSTARRRAAN